MYGVGPQPRVCGYTMEVWGLVGTRSLKKEVDGDVHVYAFERRKA